MAVRVKRLSLGWSGNPRHIRPVPQPPRELAKRHNVVHWAEHERGGHFPAVAEPVSSTGQRNTSMTEVLCEHWRAACDSGRGAA